jgi:hypothetical protein
MTKLCLLIPFLLLGCQVSQSAEVPARACLPTAKMATTLVQDYGEIPIVAGAITADNIMIFFASPRGGTWTAVEAVPGGESCILAHGQAWRFLMPPPPEGST